MWQRRYLQNTFITRIKHGRGVRPHLFSMSVCTLWTRSRAIIRTCGTSCRSAISVEEIRRSLSRQDTRQVECTFFLTSAEKWLSLHLKMFFVFVSPVKFLLCSAILMENRHYKTFVHIDRWKAHDFKGTMSISGKETEEGAAFRQIKWNNKI